MTTLFLTGGGGFAGHHFLEHILRQTDWNVIVTDSFRHKGRSDRIAQVLSDAPKSSSWEVGESWRKRVSVVTHDLTAPFSASQAASWAGQIDYMVCYASDSHVDRSISDPVPFVLNNTHVVLNSLELARQVKPKQFVWISTDEVYGPVEATDRVGFKEWATILPSNPYSASKAAQEAIAFSYWRTFGVPVVLVNCMNMIGERQDPEKFVPLVISKVLAGEEVTIHGSEGNVGTRHYLHARNLADGVLFLLRNESPAMHEAHNITAGYESDRPDRYNIAMPDRINNLDMAMTISKIVGKSLKYEFEDFHSSRPGHDAHYGLDSTRMSRLGWTPPVPFVESLERTVRWSMAHPEWLV